MTEIIRMIGAAGTGKTRRMLELMEQECSQGIEPMQIGFVSMTRSARLEAATRAAKQFEVDSEQLIKEGWFRTMHSVAFKVTGAKRQNMLTDDTQSALWLTDALGMPVKLARVQDTDGYTFTGKTQTDAALEVWASARSLLLPVSTALSLLPPRMKMPEVGFIESVAEKYEARKRLDDKKDFVDLILELAGFDARLLLDGEYRDRLTNLAGCRVKEIMHSTFLFDFTFLPHTVRENIPKLPVWFHDEMQDCSPAMGLAFKNLIDKDKTQKVFICGDPFQSIYTFAGADHNCFLGFDVTQEEILNNSHRCTQEILDEGEKVLSGCSDYFDRGVHSASTGGIVSRVSLGSHSFDPSVDTLVLARTRRELGSVRQRLQASQIPFRSIHSRHWSPARNAIVIKILMHLKEGGFVSVFDVEEVVSVLRVGSIMQRGIKTNWHKLEKDKHKTWSLKGLAVYSGWFKEQFIEYVNEEQFMDELEGAQEFRRACELYGDAVALDPKIRIGTIHQSKGLEADDVILYTPKNYLIEFSKKTVRGLDAELRVLYVGVTRARRRLFYAYR